MQEIPKTHKDSQGLKVKQWQKIEHLTKERSYSFINIKVNLEAKKIYSGSRDFLWSLHNDNLPGRNNNSIFLCT